MSKKHHYKNKYLLIGIVTIVIILIWGFVIIYKQNSQIIDNYSNNPNMPKVHAKELTELIKLQQASWMQEILKIECESLENNEAKQFCIQQTKQVNTILWNQ